MFVFHFNYIELMFVFQVENIWNISVHQTCFCAILKKTKNMEENMDLLLNTQEELHRIEIYNEYLKIRK